MNSGKWQVTLLSSNWQVVFHLAPTKIKMESKKILEVHRVLITKHQMVIGDLALMEEKEEKTSTDHSSGKILDQTVTYKRQIGDQILVITEKEEEVKLFKENWSKYWKPSITKETIQTE